MKTIRNLVTLTGLFALFLGLGAAGAQAQTLSNPSFAGTFTLPFEAQWGRTTLPVGEYSLYYGRLTGGSPTMVEIVGKDKGSPHALILPVGINDASATKNALVCVREGNTGIVRSLQMPAIGQAADFPLPSKTERMARNGKNNNYTQLAGGPVLLQRIPVTFSKK